MKSNLVFHIVLFILIIVLVGLFIFSEKILQEGLIDGELTSKQKWRLRRNIMLGVYYATDNAMREMNFYPHDMTTTFCSQGGIDSGATDIQTIVEKVLPSLETPQEPFMTFFNNFQQTLIELLQSKDLNNRSNNETCFIFDKTMHQVAEEYSIADVFDKQVLQDAITSIVENKYTSEYQTADGIRTFVQLFMAENNFKTIMDVEFVDKYFPTNMFEDYEIYKTYVKELNKTIVANIKNMFTSVDFSKYMKVDIPRAIVSGEIPQGIIQKGDPGIIFTLSLTKDYSGNIKSPHSYCKSGLFRSISTPQDKIGDTKHFICL